MVTIKVPFLRRADFLIPIAIATALIISVDVASAVDLERGLVAYYSFDDCSAKDLSGNGNDGIIYGAKCVNGKFGKALRFDGVDDYVDCGNRLIYNLETFSLVAWVKDVTDINQHQAVITKGEGTTMSFNLMIYRNGHAYYPRKAVVVFNDGSSYFDVASTTDIGGETGWFFLVGTYDGSALKIYVNGVEENSRSTTATPATTSEKLIIGARDNEGTLECYMNGIIDEVRIYNRALSEEEIRALYERGVAPRPKLAIEMDIDTSLKQGEVRKGTIRVENIGNSDAKSVKVRLFSESLGIDVEKSYARIPSGEAREFLFEVSANDAGTFKLSAHAEYWDDKGNKYVETADKFVHVKAVVLPTSQPTSQAPKTPEARETARPAGFYAFFASLLMAVSYFLIRSKGKKN